MTEPLSPSELWEAIQQKRAGKTFINKGYLFVRPTEWYTGKLNGGFVAAHVLIACAAAEITRVPDGYDVHHIDYDKLNNDPHNLQVLTHSDHAKLHAADRRRRTP